MLLGGLFDIDSKKTKLKELETQMNKDNFWENQEESFKISKEYNNLKELITKYDNLLDNTQFYIDNYNDLTESTNEIENYINDTDKSLIELENEIYFSGEFDKLNCYLEIHPGAGGTESCDWASMLLKMYERFCEKNDFLYDVVEYQDGEEAGIKSVTLSIKGFNAYAYLKFEAGVHRLVRISPFDSNSRRHTSFASVTVTPEFDNMPNIELNETDLKIDVYHSSGAGGQSVNTTNSAVRITHLPTKTVVTCQNERSQLKNKETALKILKNKLYELELEKNNDKVNSLKGNDININFGSQIRSYVLEPYKMVKDNRTNFESNDPDKILNGEILEMLIYNLKTLK